MKRPILLLAASCSLAFTLNSSSTVLHYVDLNCTNPVSPYTDWSTAATNIQNAISSAGPGDLILVTNGLYQYGGVSGSRSGNRVYIWNYTTVQSVNGPAYTFIQGYQDPAATNGPNAVRCVNLNDGATLSGFTLMNGATQKFGYGGGVYCSSTNCLVTNCVIIGNAAYDGGGGAYQGTLVNCALIGNSVAPLNIGSGGGAYQSCLINCLLVGNYVGYIGGGAVNSTLINCTVANNVAAADSGSVGGCTLKNCIVYYNFSNYTNDDYTRGSYFTNCCVSFPINSYSGANNFTNPPVFVNLATGDYHLDSASTCINVGNNSFVASSTDLDGNPRIVGGIVDIGAYENQFAGSPHFVNLNNTTPVAPYTNWLTAATNIQDAVDAAYLGNTVYVSNGVYQTGGRVADGSFASLTNRVIINKPLTVQSANGPATTVIQGSGPIGNGAVRCAYLANGAVLSGFTLTNGATLDFENPNSESKGGGVWCESVGAIVTNCVITANSAFDRGGGAWNGTLKNCTLTGNAAADGGGAYSNTLNNCTIISNTASSSGGGVQFGALNNCIVMGNSAVNGNGGGTFYGTLTNCTLTGNSAFSQGGGAYSGSLKNCIIYYNTASSNPNLYGGVFNYSCTTPSPGTGARNITNEPVFVNPSGGDFHLQSNSPCINAGKNSYVTVATDLDGNPRTVGGTVDMGAYECQSPALLAYFTWLQSYALPTDAADIYTDTDNDGMNNWQEWQADTSPLDANDFLHITSFTRNGTYNTLWWTSKSTRLYQVQRREKLDDASPWETIITNVAPGWNNVGFDNTGPQYFYRIQAVWP
jgi:parallel beta-helix repeat protein